MPKSPPGRRARKSLKSEPVSLFCYRFWLSPLHRQITTLQAQIETHRSSHASYLEIVQRRVDAFAGITPIVDDVKSMKLPVEVLPDVEDGGMDIDSPTAVADTTSDLDRKSGQQPPGLSGSALPFLPTGPSATTASTSTRNTPALPPTAPSSRAASHALPHRPSGRDRKSPSIPTAPGGSGGGRGGGGNRASSASLPQRPSGLRSSATPGRSLLEEGEVEGEEGEVADRKSRGGGRRR